MATFTTCILKGPVHIKADGTTNLKIRVYHAGSTSYISTPYYVKPDDLSSKGLVKKSNKDYSHINNSLSTLISKYNSLYIQLDEKAGLMSCLQLKKYITSKSSNPKGDELDFIKFGREEVERIKQVKQGKDTATWYECALNQLEEYMKGMPLNVNTINYQFLYNLEMDLRRCGSSGYPLSMVTINSYMRAIRALINKMKNIYNDEDTGDIKIVVNPFKKYKIPAIDATATHYKHLTLAELKALKNANIELKSRQYYRDMAMLMFYLMGINGKDLYNLGKADRNGYVSYRRAKTDTPFYIKLEPEAIDIIKRYEGEKTLINACDLYGDHKGFMKYVSAGVKKILEGLEINKDFSTNWMRHTWATIAHNEAKINDGLVAKCLGHEYKKNKVTHIYINDDTKVIEESNRIVIDLLK